MNAGSDEQTRRENIMSLNIRIESRPGNFHLIVLDGKLDSSTYTQLETKINAIGPTAKVMMFDMSKLSYISSMGLRVLLMARKTMDAQRGQFVMLNLQPQIAKVFEIANALPGVTIFSSVAEADSYFDAMQRKELEKQGKA